MLRRFLDMSSSNKLVVGQILAKQGNFRRSEGEP